MFTLPLIKHCAKSLDNDDIKQGKAYADWRRKWGLWWAFDCVEMYQRFSRTNDKVFWWKMVVKTFRYANDYSRKNTKQNAPTSL